MIRALVVAIVLTAAGIGGYMANRQWFAGDVQSAAATAPASESRVSFSLADVGGTSHSLDEWRGKALLVNFWATWCAPCRREIPLLIETQAEHGGDNLQVIGVAVDDTQEVAAYAETAGFNYPVLVGQDDAIAAAEDAGIEFVGLPFTMVIAPDGRLIKTHLGELAAGQVAAILEVFDRMETGDLDMDGAREALGRF